MTRTKTVSGPKRVYIAGKFRGPKNQDVQRHVDVAAWFRAPIAEAGCFPVCVHVGEGLAMHDVQQADNGQFWLDVTLDELRTCDAVVLVPGWQTSSGTYWEVLEALQLGMPVFEAAWEDAVDFTAMPEIASTNQWIRVASILGDAGSAFADDYAAESFEGWAAPAVAPTRTPGVGDSIVVRALGSMFDGQQGVITAVLEHSGNFLVTFNTLYHGIPFNPAEVVLEVLS